MGRGAWINRSNAIRPYDVCYVRQVGWRRATLLVIAGSNCQSLEAIGRNNDDDGT